MKKESIPYLRKKADRSLQEWGRRTYNYCLVCGKPMNVLHHYYPKSTSSALRYNKNNCIPLCSGCHFSHHNGNPMIHNTINDIKGKSWLQELKDVKNTIIKINKGYYRGIIDYFNNK